MSECTTGRIDQSVELFHIKSRGTVGYRRVGCGSLLYDTVGYGELKSPTTNQ